MVDLPLEQIQPGQLIADRYRLEEPIGRGGMGAVWRAVHTRLEAPVAIKLLNSAIADDPEMLERFLREARSAAAVRSSHVVQIFDYGVDRDMPYIAMELLVGEALDARLTARGVLEPPELDKIFTEVARAVSNAHAQGVVHRDLKPANIFIAREGDLEVTKVLDFGIAKLLDERLAAPVGSGTHTGNILGTPNYMSPEQARGQRQVDHRSDLWSLAVVAFECLTGRQPFESTTLGDLVVKICTAQPPVPSSVAPVPAAFDAWFLKGMSKDPAGRFRSALEMADELHALLSAEGMGADSRSRASTDRRFPPDGVELRGRAPSEAPGTPRTPGTPRPSRAPGETAAGLGGPLASSPRQGTTRSASDTPAHGRLERTLLTSTGALATEVLERPRSSRRGPLALALAVLVLAAVGVALGPGRALLGGAAPASDPTASSSEAGANSHAGGSPVAGPGASAPAATGAGALAPGAVSTGAGVASDSAANAAPAASASPLPDPDAASTSSSASPAGPVGAGPSRAEAPSGAAPRASAPSSEAASTRTEPASRAKPTSPAAAARDAHASRTSGTKAARSSKAPRAPAPEPPPATSAPPASPPAAAPAAPFDPFADRL